jgi:hypothetical protein
MAFSRYQLGEVNYFHKNVLINSSVGSSYQDQRIREQELLYDYDVAVVPVGYEHRPDLISNVFYQTPAYWFLLMQVNNISDPYEGFNVGDQILIPKIK